LIKIKIECAARKEIAHKRQQVRGRERMEWLYANRD
jgi:hypothetical protein